jgi:hypothetical protein
VSRSFDSRGRTQEWVLETMGRAMLNRPQNVPDELGISWLGAIINDVLGRVINGKQVR